MARVNPACTAALSCSTRLCETLKFGKSALVNLAQPGIQALSLPLPHHVKKALDKLIGGIERRMCQTKSGQIFSLDLVQMRLPDA